MLASFRDLGLTWWSLSNSDTHALPVLFSSSYFILAGILVSYVCRSPCYQRYRFTYTIHEEARMKTEDNIEKTFQLPDMSKKFLQPTDTNFSLGARSGIRCQEHVKGTAPTPRSLQPNGQKGK